jgi:glyoxylase-like metal-dependent hydrolase (beta-lactamase superfamily II)
VSLGWERLADAVFRCRLPFLDVTAGLVCGRDGAVLIDSGSTLPEARAIAGDVHSMACRAVSHIVLTHHHFDHILGASAFKIAEIYCAPQVGVTMAERTDHLRADALRYGADTQRGGPCHRCAARASAPPSTTSAIARSRSAIPIAAIPTTT